MTTIEEMEEFVDWANAGAAVDTGLDLGAQGALNTDMDLAFGNIDGDDFSFWALQHFDTNFAADPNATAPSNLQDLDFGILAGVAGDVSPAIECWVTPDAPCDHCKSGNYQCKLIQEGTFKGYCTSCVALRCECSFGPTRFNNIKDGGATFPPNPWPTLGDHPNAIGPEDGLHKAQGILMASNIMATVGEDTVSEAVKSAVAMPKIGARFSRESVRILKNWLSTHGRHPYPTEEEKESLQRQTGLNKTQITNWLANARRRGKIQPTRSTSPHVSSWAGTGASGAIDIPRRRGTPAMEEMNPLQRWVDSPPEHEPASVTAIARAVTASTSTLSSGLNSPHSFNNSVDDGSGKSLCNQSSASSLNTSHSHSNQSSQSAYSHKSKGSFGSYGSSFNNSRGRRRRRRRATPKRPEDLTTTSATAVGAGTALTPPLKTFQCTFCTETFRTKHDWQRHEKSLHLSLERWVCAPDGPRVLNSDTGFVSCVFCGEANPDDAHVEAHNYSACQERSLEERTFYRKDHLRQHLKLVHDVKFIGWSMEPWKVATPEIRSRCGFCGIVMDSWTIRTDHLAEHFKTGNTMADWKGDWGFEPPILELVENSIPPYLIHDERNSPLPFVASQPSPESPANAYDLIKLELAYWMSHEIADKGRMPTDEEMQYEACRIIFGSEVLSQGGPSSSPAWLRDLIMSNEQIARGARLSPVRGQAENRMSSLHINGKDNLFDDDSLEQQLREFVKARTLLGLTAMDGELQVEACRIVSRMEESSNKPFEMVANWLIRLVYSSAAWLAPFRRRCHLPRSEDLADENQRSRDPTTIDSTVHNYSRLEVELAQFVRMQRSLGAEPTDADLQRQARLIIYEYEDGWNQTAADNDQWLSDFKQRHMVEPGASAVNNTDVALTLESLLDQTANANMASDLSGDAHLAPCGMPGPQQVLNSYVKTSPFFLNDANCYRRLARELIRWAQVTMSPNNPNCHVPSDEEIQHQARWILYDDDDPWNQTAADNAEWLRRFKRDAGILKDESGPGLPETDAWAVKLGGSGFAPPYAFPRAAMQPFRDGSTVQIPLRDGAKLFNAPNEAANKWLNSFTSRYPAPATVFCSRELEKGLTDYVEGRFAHGVFPADDELKGKAREILATETTAADDSILLEKFKRLMKRRLEGGMSGAEESEATSPEGGAPLGEQEDDESEHRQSPEGGLQLSAMPPNLDPNMSDNEINDMLQEMQFEFDDGAALDANRGLAAGLGLRF